MSGGNDIPKRPVYSKERWDLLVVMLPGCSSWVVVEVIGEHPFRLKATENGPLSDLDGGDCIIHALASAAVQRGDASRAAIANDFARDGNPLLSGLDRLGMNGERLSLVTFL